MGTHCGTTHTSVQVICELNERQAGKGEAGNGGKEKGKKWIGAQKGRARIRRGGEEIKGIEEEETGSNGHLTKETFA